MLPVLLRTSTRSAVCPARLPVASRSLAYSAILRADQKETKVPFSAPKTQPTSQVPEGSFSNASFPTESEAKEEIATPPIIPTANAKHDSTTQVPAPSKAPVQQGAGRVSTSSGNNVNVSHTQHDKDVSQESVDESLGQPTGDRGLGNFKKHAERKAEDLANKASEKADEVTEKAQGVMQSLEETTGFKVPDLSAEIKGKGKAPEFEYQDRKLNDKERNGLYLLGGLIVTGWLAGGLAKPNQPKKQKGSKA